MMKLNLLALALVVLVLAACGRPEQALPEQEKSNFERITGDEQSQ